MALNPIPIGDSIATYLYNNPLGQGGTPVSLANMKLIWENVMTLIYNDIKANMDVLPAAHSGEGLSAPAGQPLDVTSGPGAGSTGATTTDVILNGKGSVT